MEREKERAVKKWNYATISVNGSPSVSQACNRVIFLSLYTSPRRKPRKTLSCQSIHAYHERPEFQNNVFPGSGELHCENNVEVAL